MADLPEDQKLTQSSTPNIPVSGQPPIEEQPTKQPGKSTFPPKQEETPSLPKKDVKAKLSFLGVKPSEPKKPPKRRKIVLAVLSLLLILGSIPAAVYLVKQRQEIRKEAETPPSPAVVKSVAGQGVWKKITHDGYPGCWSASECSLVLYSPADGWTSLGFDDSSWSTKNFTVHSGWWDKDDWVCKNTYFTSNPQTISIVDDNDTIFPDKNGVTGLHRKRFQLTIPAGYQIASAELRMFSDNKTAIYLNGDTGGGLIVSNIEGCYLASVSPQFLNQGENVLAVQLSNDHVNDADNPVGMQYELTINFAPTPTPTPTSTPTSTPTPTPTSTPTPTPSLACLDLASASDPTTVLLSPEDEITLTCTGSSDPSEAIDHFDFRVSIDEGTPVDLGATPATGADGEYQAQKSYAIPDYGCYEVECRACTSSDSSECTEWGQANGT